MTAREKSLVHGEPLARPVAGSAETAQLARDRIAQFLLPGPHAREKRLPPHGSAICLVLLREKPLDDHLRCDAGMIGAGLPQDIATPKPLETADDVLNGVVEGVPHMERSRHIGRRDNNRERLRLGTTSGFEISALLPLGIEAGFNFGWGKGLVEHGRL